MNDRGGSMRISRWLKVAGGLEFWLEVQCLKFTEIRRNSPLLIKVCLCGIRVNGKVERFWKAQNPKTVAENAFLFGKLSCDETLESQCVLCVALQRKVAHTAAFNALHSLQSLSSLFPVSLYVHTRRSIDGSNVQAISIGTRNTRGTGGTGGTRGILRLA